MKILSLIVSLFLMAPFALAHEAQPVAPPPPMLSSGDVCEVDECGYHTKIVYTIYRPDGTVANEATDDLRWNATLEQAIAHKYKFYELIFGRDQQTGRSRAHALSDAAME